MTPLEILQEHHRVCDEVHQCTLDENRHLREHRCPADAALMERKTTLRARLDTSLAALRDLPAGGVRDPAARAQLETTRNRILQILQLDRENEQLLLRCSLSIARPPVATPLPQGIHAAPSPAIGPILQTVYGGNARRAGK